MTTSRNLADDLRVLRHPPGTAKRELEEWLAAERRKDAKKSAANKAKEAEAQEAQALHMARTAHGLVKALHQMMPAASESKSSVDAALERGRKWRETKKLRRPTGATVDQLRRFRSEAYRPGKAETTSADRTSPRWR